MTDSSVRRTVQSYDQVATDYLARWHDRRIMSQQVDRFVSLLAHGKDAPLVADIGCGPGFDADVLRGRGLRVVGLDLSWGMLATGRLEYPGEYIRADMRTLPLASLVLDGLWVNASLLHLPREDVPATLAGFARVLRPGGCLFLAVKRGQGEDWHWEAYGRSQPRFFTYWQPAELDALLSRTGLTVIDGGNAPAGDSTDWLARFALR